MTTDTSNDPSVWDDEGRLFVLRVLLDTFANNEESSFGLTLHVDGAIVSGTAVSRARWLRALTQEGQAPQNPTTAREHLAAALHKMANDWADEDATDEETDPAATLRRQHVYLINTNVYPVGAGLGSSFSAWQVPLVRVSGWTLGEMTRH